MSRLASSGLGRRKDQDGAVLPTSQLHIPMPKVTPPPPANAKPSTPTGGESKARG
jgi:hypothetical protein